MDVDGSPHRDPELWFDDGNIILQAGNNMLDFPQPSDSERVEGCPLVRLVDSETEVAVFLKAIFDSEFFRPFPVYTELKIIVGVLRLSHKYEVGHLGRRALIHLSSTYDTELARWDRVTVPTDELGHSNMNHPAINLRSWWWTQNNADFIVLIPLVQEVGALWLLPDIFYNFAAVFHELDRDIFIRILTQLSVENQMAFFSGHAIQSKTAASEIMGSLSTGIIDGCSTPEKCTQRRLIAVDDLTSEIGDNPSDPLGIWGTGDWLSLAESVCPTCLASLRTTHQAARQEFWDELPEIYVLPSWEELEKLKLEAIGTNWLT
ncbi:hypothetical protein FB45DRAFT_1065475 [Roridomyces roridus]|uniref:Uncharacterized protein n=1 Tax=Roridomyces roridus TaxID=1738132 RepID=A0AAD7B6B2_9AGAR|nr:hypothetical protein FB45DRAFT_1065475 [Roridomyces roridus]